MKRQIGGLANKSRTRQSGKPGGEDLKPKSKNSLKSGEPRSNSKKDHVRRAKAENMLRVARDTKSNKNHSSGTCIVKDKEKKQWLSYSMKIEKW